MEWWVWLLLAWAGLATAGAVVLGMGIRTAERRDLGNGRSEQESDDTRDAA